MKDYEFNTRFGTLILPSSHCILCICGRAFTNCTRCILMDGLEQDANKEYYEKWIQ